MKILAWTTFFIGAFGVPIGVVLFVLTANPLALFDTVWAGALAFAGWYLARD